MATVRNQERPPITFRRVWRTKDGMAPTLPDDATDAQRAKAEAVESYQLKLGGSDASDADVDAHNAQAKKESDRRPYSHTEIPQWALDRYRGRDGAVGCRIFQAREEAGIINVTSQA